MTLRVPFAQIDVFTDTPLFGNPLAVVLDGRNLSDAEMQRFANWTNLSETTFVLPPTDPGADYRVRIFTTDRELPFAGHPTIGTCHAWLAGGGTPNDPSVIVQECGIGLVKLRRFDGRLAFAAPDLIRSGPVAEDLLLRATRVLDIDRSAIVDAQWADNGPGWIAIQLADAEAVLAVAPNFDADDAYDIGIVGPYPIDITAAGPSTANSGPSTAEGGPSIEVRAFFRSKGVGVEDPVTGSLNAALAQWLLTSGKLEAPYIAHQGTALGRAGRVFVNQDENGTIWVGGDAVAVVEGTAHLQ